MFIYLKSHVEALIPNIIVSVDGAFWKFLGHENRAFTMGLTTS